MPQNVFLDKSSPPTAEQFAAALGASLRHWEALKRHVETTHGAVREEWKYYGATIGWTLKLLLGKRNLLFVTAREGAWHASLVLGDKAVAAAQASTLPPALIEELVQAKKYAEGRGVRLVVRTRKELTQAMTLVDIKIAH